MVVRVSIIVPLHNSARHLDAPLASFDAQTMPARQFQVFLGYDGSTDDTLARVRVGAHHRAKAWSRRSRTPAGPGGPATSVWTSPRPVPFFLDHDDALAPRALACTSPSGLNRADIVSAKLVRSGRTSPYGRCGA